MRARLALEAGASIRIGRECRRQHFERDVAAELAVVGAVDLAHAARAERREDLEVPHPRYL
jgi:hypothetical protein